MGSQPTASQRHSVKRRPEATTRERHRRQQAWKRPGELDDSLADVFGGELLGYVRLLIGGFCLIGGSIAGAIAGATSLPVAAIGVVAGVLCAAWGRERLREYNRSGRY
jgi:hypothetical protein